MIISYVSGQQSRFSSSKDNLLKLIDVNIFLAWTVCNAGSYASTEATSTSDRTCSKCAPGYYCSGGNRLAQPCGNGTLFSKGGQYMCTVVTNGYYSAPLNVSMFARTNQLPCEAGFFCVNGARTACPLNTWSNARQDACITCSTCSAGSEIIANCTASTNVVCLGLRNEYVYVNAFCDVES